MLFKLSLQVVASYEETIEMLNEEIVETLRKDSRGLKKQIPIGISSQALGQ
jgi:hypothetical protein